jgi:hypothetical protein
MPELLTVTSVANSNWNVVPFPFTKVRVDVTHVVNRGKIHKTVDFVAVAGVEPFLGC